MLFLTVWKDFVLGVVQSIPKFTLTFLDISMVEIFICYDFSSLMFLKLHNNLQNAPKEINLFLIDYYHQIFIGGIISGFDR